MIDLLSNNIYSAPAAPTVTWPATSPTNDGTVTVVITGDATSWKWSRDGGGTWTPGSGMTFVLPEGIYESERVRVIEMDDAGNGSPSAKNTAQIIVDTTIPSTPIVDFPDSPSNDGTVTVTLASDAASWEYSVDTGSSWTTGTGTSGTVSFTLADGIYGIDALQVRNSDAAGNPSDKISNTDQIVIDTVALPAPTVEFPVSPSSDGTVTVNLDSDAVSWQYSLNSGITWTPGHGSGEDVIVYFVLPVESFAVSQIQVRQIDAAGNISPITANHEEEIIVTSSLPVQVEFNVIQQIGHMTLSAYDSDPDAALNFKSTAAFELGLGYSSNIVNLQVTQTNERRLRRRLQTDTLDFAYVVKFIVGDGNDYESAEVAYSESLERLDNSIADGTFTALLQSKDGSFTDATVDTPAVVSEPIVTIDPAR